MTRGINNLLILVLKEYDLGRNRDGLCYTVCNMEDTGVINFDEYGKLMNYIEDNRPYSFFSFRNLFGTDSAFYWERGLVKPRVKWLKKHIKLTSK